MNTRWSGLSQTAGRRSGAGLPDCEYSIRYREHGTQQETSRTLASRIDQFTTKERSTEVEAREAVYDLSKVTRSPSLLRGKTGDSTDVHNSHLHRRSPYLPRASALLHCPPCLCVVKTESQSGNRKTHKKGTFSGPFLCLLVAISTCSLRLPAGPCRFACRRESAGLPGPARAPGRRSRRRPPHPRRATCCGRSPGG